MFKKSKYLYIICCMLSFCILTGCVSEEKTEPHNEVIEQQEDDKDVEKPAEGTSEEQEKPSDNTQDPANNPSDSTGSPGIIEPIIQGLPNNEKALGSLVLNATEVNIKEANNRFAFSLLSELYKGESMVFSPLSIEMALSMVANGTEGETTKEIIAAILGTGYSTDLLNEYNHRLLELLPAVDTTVKLNMANALIADISAPIKEDYSLNIESLYYAIARNMDFSHFEEVRSTINDWCYRVTNGLIPTILDDNNVYDALLFLINTLYLKAPWEVPFNKRFLYEGDFYKSNGTIIKKDYLQKVEYFKYATKDNFTILSCNLGKEGLFSMNVFLPGDGGTIEGVIEELSRSGVDSNLLDLKRSFLHIRIPIFETENTYQLPKALQALGIQRAFNASLADFSNLLQPGYSAFIGSITHKARIQINPDGLEGAAATIVEAAGSSGETEQQPTPIPFFANHPFIYTIIEKASGVILFVGVYDGH